MIIGAAFGKIVDSLVKDLIMPVVGRIFGGLDFSNYFVVLAAAPAGLRRTDDLRGADQGRRAAVRLGQLPHGLLNFLILAFIIFMMVRQINQLRRAEPPPPARRLPEDTVLLREIRDALKR